MKYTDNVNVFQGCGEIDLPKPEGIAAKWFFIKAGCGNTSPAACVPFGAMSVAPYSGGYSSGYGNHVMNSHSRPAKFADGDKLLGFAHIQQSGVGSMGYYYNYCVITPKYKNSEERRTPKEEEAKPGYYSCVLDDIKCELTSSSRVAFHRYIFGSENGEVVADLSNNGLCYNEEIKGVVENLYIKNNNGDIITASAKIEGINIYFALKGNGVVNLTNSTVTYSDFGKEFNLKVCISLVDEKTAVKELNNADGFDNTKMLSEKIWNDALGKIDIETEDKKIKEIFYSNLYHSFIKPSDWFGESFIYEKGKPFYSDFATFWDLYKTSLPLIFMLFKDRANEICETIMLLGEKLGFIPNSIGLCDSFLLHDTQARTLGCYVLLTAYRYGADIDPHRMLKVICNDIYAPNKTDFTVDGKCSSHTFILDMADCCALAAEVALEKGETEIYNKLIPLADKWKACYNEATGLLKDDCEYYEGSLYNYSFRQMVHMDERIKIAGGKENFIKLLDDFFGYGKEDIIQPTNPFDKTPVFAGEKLGRFEGFNNESDMEAPFSYVFAGRHDRTCEIIRYAMKYMFTTGRGGLPGNNDSGALSSYYVMMAFGLFPVAGQDLFVIGSPFVDKAVLSLFNSKKLEIEIKNNSDKNIYVDSVKFNGKEIDGFMIKASDLLKGGKLEFVMTDNK